MGAKQPSARVGVNNSGGKVPIFKLLLKLSRIGGTKDDNEEFDLLFFSLFDTPIDDVSYQALEIYIRNFVLHNLLHANLRHGNLYRYWERYTALLAQIAESGSLGAPHTREPTKYPIGNMNSSRDMAQAVISDEDSFGCLRGAACRSPLCKPLLHPTNYSRSRHPEDTVKSAERLIPITVDASSNPYARRDSAHATPYAGNMSPGIYKRLYQGTCDPNRSLTLFVISKILCKCIADTISTPELLFHIDYLPHYLVQNSLLFFKLDLDGSKDFANEDIPEKNVCNNEHDDQNLNWNATTYDIFESSAEHLPTAVVSNSHFPKSSEIGNAHASLTNAACESSNHKNIFLRFCAEETVLVVEVPVGVKVECITDAVLTGAMRLWSHGTVEALKKGFCLVDTQMRIFSLENIGVLLENAKENIEFMVLPFCTSTYGTIGITSHLQRLLQALFSYITSDIRPLSSSHDIFLKGSQSMVADVLVILLSCVVMKPYLCANSTLKPELCFPPEFGWVRNAPMNTRLMAPFYYIHMDCVRSQLMLDKHSDGSPSDLQAVIEYVINYDDHMNYGLLDSLRFVIGPRGLGTTAQCLVRLLKTHPSNGSKRYLDNLRTNLALLLLLLLYHQEANVTSYIEGADEPSCSPVGSYTSPVFSSAPPQIAGVLEKVDINIHRVIPHEFELTNLLNIGKLDSILSHEQLSELAKGLLDIGASKLSSNEIMLVLVDVLSQSSNFTAIFYAEANNFIKEVVSTIRKHSKIPKPKHDPYLVTTSPLLRTLIRILTHYVIHHKNNDIHYASLDMERILPSLVDVFEWNLKGQKDDHLVNSVLLLINQLVEIPIVVNRVTSEKILVLLCSWMSAASALIDSTSTASTPVDVECISLVILIKMVMATLNIIKAALSPATLDTNIDLLHAILEHCGLVTLEDMLFHFKNPIFDATCKVLKLGAIMKHTIALLDFVSLTVRTFTGFKMHSMYSLAHNKTGFSSHGLVMAVSDLIRQMDEGADDTKSALALAIAKDFGSVMPPTGISRRMFHYHMSQLWLAAYNNQHQLSLWQYYYNK